MFEANLWDTDGPSSAIVFSSITGCTVKYEVNTPPLVFEKSSCTGASVSV